MWMEASVAFIGIGVLAGLFVIGVLLYIFNTASEK